MARGGEVGKLRAVAAFAASASARWLSAAQRGAHRTVGGGTAITAAVLSILGSIYMLLMAVNGGWLVYKNADFLLEYGSVINQVAGGTAVKVVFAAQVLFALSALIACVLLGVGGVQLLRRSARGAKLVMAGSGVTLGWVALGGFWTVYAMVQRGHLTISPVLVPGIITLIAVPFALATLVLAMVPPTRRWVEAGK